MIRSLTLHKTSEMLPFLLVILIQAQPLSGMPVTQNPQTTYPIPPGCVVDGKWYAPGSDVSRGSDGNGWCFGEYCDYDGHLTVWDDWNCATTPPPHDQTTTPFGCVSNGVWYAPGSEVSRGSDEKGNEWGTICADDGQLIAWGSWNHKMSTTPYTSTTTSPPITTEQSTAAFSTTQPTPSSPTTPPASSLPPPTTHVGCFQYGKWYPPGSEISRGSDGKGWCYGLYCTPDGQLQPWDNWNCDPTTTEPPSPSTTAAPTTSPAPSPTTVPIPLGCLQNGAWYEPGSEISRESDGEGWCHGISCDANGQIVTWDDWNCEATDDPPSEETQAGEPQGCYYENQWHPHGSIFEGSDSNGCKYGAICGIDGQVTRWDEFDCQSTEKQSE